MEILLAIFFAAVFIFYGGYRCWQDDQEKLDEWPETESEAEYED